MIEMQHPHLAWRHGPCRKGAKCEQHERSRSDLQVVIKSNSKLSQRARRSSPNRKTSLSSERLRNNAKVAKSTAKSLLPHFASPVIAAAATGFFGIVCSAIGALAAGSEHRTLKNTPCYCGTEHSRQALTSNSPTTNIEQHIDE
jgi:hypothetical protein